VTRRRHYLTEIIPAGRQAEKDAEKARTRLLSQVASSATRTRATVNQMLDRHLEMLSRRGGDARQRRVVRS
jgi:hypothetical protein